MISKANRIKEIEKQITENLPSGLYKVKQVQKEMLERYSKDIRLNSVPDERFNTFNFLSELIHKCEKLEKKALIKKLSKQNKIVGLEVHTFAPELNRVHFSNGSEYRTPNAENLTDALMYHISLQTLKKYSLTNQI